MGRTSSRSSNNSIDIPWDHYSFDLGGSTDLQPQLRKKVELVETDEGFCMFYPRHRRRQDQSKDRSAGCNSKVETYAEAREPNTSFQSDLSSVETTNYDAAAVHTQNYSRSSRAKHSVLYPKHPQKKAQNNNNGDDVIDRPLNFQGNNLHYTQRSQSFR